jgi:hypothetical protein
LSALSTRSPPLPATHPAHSDQASRPAVRLVTRLLGCRGQRTSTPVSLVAQADPSDGALSCPAVVVRLGLLGVLLTWDRSGIVTDFVSTWLTLLVIQPSGNSCCALVFEEP